MPNYNHGHFISRALGSLSNQTVQPHEILIVDDCSTDDSIDVIEQHARSLPQLRLFRNKSNRGLNECVNGLLGRATGTYVLCTAADDWLEPLFIERMSAAAASFPDAKLLTSQYVEYFEASNTVLRHDARSDLGGWYAPPTTHFFTNEEFASCLKRAFVWLPINGALVHRDTFRQIGGFDSALRWHSDWFVTYTLAFRYGFVFVPEPLSAFRVAATSYSGKGMRNRAEQRRTCSAIYQKIRQPEFRDIYESLRCHPAAFSPFVHHLVEALALDMRAWPFLWSVALWWFKEASRGRRPGFVRRIARSAGINTFPL